MLTAYCTFMLLLLNARINIRGIIVLRTFSVISNPMSRMSCCICWISKISLAAHAFSLMGSALQVSAFLAGTCGFSHIRRPIQDWRRLSTACLAPWCEHKKNYSQLQRMLQGRLNVFVIIVAVCCISHVLSSPKTYNNTCIRCMVVAVNIWTCHCQCSSICGCIL